MPLAMGRDLPSPRRSLQLILYENISKNFHQGALLPLKFISEVINTLGVITEPNILKN